MLKRIIVIAIVGCLVFSVSFVVGRFHVDYIESQNVEMGENVIPREYKLLSASIETKNFTNKDKITNTGDIFCYEFETNSGEVISKEKQILESYEGNYALKFEVGNENKILQYGYQSQTLLVFVMTKEMHDQVFQK